MINRFDPIGSTAEVDFMTRKAVIADGEVRGFPRHPRRHRRQHLGTAPRGRFSSSNRNVTAYVKNDHLGFTIPYVHKGRTHSYIPDFLVRLEAFPDDASCRTLIVEVSGSQKSPGPTRPRRPRRANSWCVAVNNHGGFGRWGYIEMTDPLQFKPASLTPSRRSTVISPIIGDPDLLDFDDRSARGA